MDEEEKEVQEIWSVSDLDDEKEMESDKKGKVAEGTMFGSGQSRGATNGDSTLQSLSRDSLHNSSSIINHQFIYFKPILTIRTLMCFLFTSMTRSLVLSVTSRRKNEDSWLEHRPNSSGERSTYTVENICGSQLMTVHHSP